MKKASCVLLSTALLLLAYLLASPQEGWAQQSPNAVSGSPTGSRFVIHGEPEQEVAPSIAYNPQMQEYLVVWYNDLPGNDDIHAERVSRNGKLLRHPCVACGPGADRRYPDVAYNSQRNEYLVVWVEEDAGGLSYVRAQRLDSQGNLLGSMITLVGGPIGMLTSANPAVAYASTPDKYLIVWEYEVNMPLNPVVISIVGQVVSGGGVLEGSAITISGDPGGEPRQQPDVAYNRHGNGHLVVWEQWDAGASRWTVYGRLVNGDGGTPFSPIWISDYIVSCMAPAVAAIPTSPTPNKYLVVWEIGGSVDRDIFGRFVAEDGSLGPSDVHFQQGDGIDQSSPAIAGDELSQRYLVTWRHPEGAVYIPIHGRAVSSTGGLLGDEAVFEGPAADRPAVAAGQVGSFLVAWQDKAPWATNTDLYGQLWGNRTYLPLIKRKF